MQYQEYPLKSAAILLRFPEENQTEENMTYFCTVFAEYETGICVAVNIIGPLILKEHTLFLHFLLKNIHNH